MRRALLLTGCAAALACPGTALALNFEVTTLDDGVDANPGDEVCEALDTGECTLRAAIIEANALGGEHTIELQNLDNEPYQLTVGDPGDETEDLDVTASITVVGIDSGVVIDALESDRAFHVHPEGELVLQSVKVVNGLVGQAGGAIYNDGRLELLDAWIADSRSGDSHGGGLMNFGVALVRRSALTGNSAASLGGAIHNAGDATLTMENVTVSGNTASDGGGLWNDGSAAVSSATFFGNVSLSGFVASLVNDDGGLSLFNSILASTTTANCGGGLEALGNVYSLEVEGEWEVDLSCDPDPDLDLGGDPRLGPLTDNGGPTPTHALLDGSPAIDSNVVDGCAQTDQRGVARPQPEDGNCDRGAYEVEFGAGDTFVVTTTADTGEGSLRAAIAEANTDADKDQIVFEIPGEGPFTITPLSGLPTISRPLAIFGFSQPGGAGTPIVHLDGAAAGPSMPGLQVDSGGSDSEIHGLSITGFTWDGVKLLGATDVIVAGNWIGLTPSGILDGNGTYGVLVDFGSTGAEINGNTIVGSGGADEFGYAGVGVWNGSHDVLLRRNRIGVDPDGTPMPNARGVIVASSDGVVVGRGDGDGNTITDNEGVGIWLFDADGATVQENEIVGNAGAGVLITDSSTGSDLVRNAVDANGGLGIDLGGDGVTENDLFDADGGPNGLQNFPEIESAVLGDGSVRIVGELFSAQATAYRLDWFASPSCDPSGHGEGARWIGWSIFTTNADGFASIDTGTGITADVAAGEWVTGTATAPDGSTSELSACAEVVGDGTIVVDTAAAGGDESCDDGTCSLVDAVDLANAREGHDTIVFALDGVATIPLEETTLVLSDPVTIDGTGMFEGVPGPGVEIDGQNTGVDCFRVTAPDVTIRGLSIYGCVDGIDVTSAGTFARIEGNHVGLTAAGAPVGNSGSGIRVNGDETVVGGDTADERNVVSASLGTGITVGDSEFGPSEVEIRGNHVGTNPEGTGSEGNAVGVEVNLGAGGTTVVGNVLSGNLSDGVELTGGGSVLEGNLVGVAVDGTPLGNEGNGVTVRGSGQAVGGTTDGAANTIANNEGAGVAVLSGSGHSILGNSIDDNDLLGIDLGGDGVDEEGGAPKLTGVAFTEGGVEIAGTIELGGGAVARIEFFASPACDPSGFGEGRRFLAFTSVGTFEIPATVPFEALYPELDLAEGEVVTATATVSGSTTEFSNCVAAGGVEASLVLEAEVESVEAGAAELPLGDIPLELLTAANGDGTAGAPLSGIPLSGIPLSGIPLSGIPLSGIPLSGIPLSGIGLGDPDVLAILRGIPLSSVPVSVPGGWPELLKDTRFKGVPAQSLSLGEVLGDPAAAAAVGAVTLGDSGLAASPLSGIPLSGILLGGLPLSGIPLSGIGSSPAENLAAWCEAIREAGGTCADPGSLSGVSVIELALRGAPLSGIPLSGIPLSGIDVAGSPLSGIPLSGIVVGTPLSGIPLSGIPLSGIGTAASPLSGIPLSGIANLDAVVDCAVFACAGATLGEAADAGAILPGATLGDLGDAALAGFELGDLGFYGDVSLGDLILALFGPEIIPWEEVDLDALPLQELADGATFRYGADLTLSGGSGALAARLSVELPAGFLYVPGSSELVTGGTPTVLADPTITGSTLEWDVTGLSAGTPYRLRFSARPSLRLGLAAAAATATPTGSPAVDAAAPAVVAVGETFEPNDDPGTAPVLAEDVLYFSYVGTAGDVDRFRFPAPPAGSRVKVYLSHLAADADLVLYAPERHELRPGAPAGVPLEGGVVDDDGVGLGLPAATRDEALAPGPTPDVPLLAGRVVAGISAHRNTESEEVAAISRSASGTYTIQVSGYNGAFSAAPYVLRVEVRAPVTPTCTPRTLALGAPGTIPASLPADLNTIFLVNQQRLAASYGPAGAADVLAEAADVAAARALGVSGAVIPVDGDAGVRAAYADWDANPCSPDGANGVVTAIGGLLDDLLAQRPGIQNVVVLGDDAIVPMARIPDLTRLFNEREFAAGFSDDQYFGALATEHVLSDDPYGDRDPIPLNDRQLFVPELAVGRLVETPAEIAAQLAQFVASGGMLDPQSALTTGYDFLSDGAADVFDALGAVVGAPGNASLIDDAWSRSTLLGQLLPAGEAPGIASINAHYDHTSALPALGNSTDDLSDLFTTADVAGAGAAKLAGRILFTMGCHAGFSVSDVVVGTAVPDWAQTFGAQGAGAYVANLGYGLGDTAIVAYSERLMALFADEIDDAATIGRALPQAKQRYFSELGVFGVYDEKVLAEAAFFGLPMYTVGVAPTPLPEPGTPPPPGPDPDPLPPLETDPITGLASAAFSFEPSLSAGDTSAPRLLKESSPRGDYWAVEGEAQATHYRPIVARTGFDATRPGTLAHGAIIEAASSFDELNQDPVYSRPTGDLSANEPELPFGDVGFPDRLQTITTFTGTSGREQRLVLMPNQFVSDETADAQGRGTQRVFTRLAGRILYSTSADHAEARLLRVDGTVTGGSVGFEVCAVDPGSGAGGVERVYVLFREVGQADWRGVDLVRTSDCVWTGGGAVAGTNVEFFVQAVDGAGNVAVAMDKTRIFQALEQPPLPAGFSATLDGAAGDNGWFRGAVTVTLAVPDGVSLEASVDGGPFIRVVGALTVDGDGLHTIDLRASDGTTGRVVVPIDATAPTIDIRVPADGSFVGAGARADYVCLDSGSGAATCTGPVAAGAPLDTSTEGTKTFRVTAVDLAGNSAEAESTYKVDSTPPNAPTLDPDRAPEFAGGGGWWKDAVTVTTTPHGDPPLADGTPGSGVDPASVTPPVTLDESGAHEVTGTVRDRAGNEASATATFQVDAAAPVVAFTSCPATIFVGAAASLPWTASDTESGLATPASGAVAADTATVGPKTATVQALDNVGHAATATCAYRVIYEFEGFFDPIDNDSFNRVTAGSAVPLKFSLNGDFGLGILAAGYPKVQVVTCEAGTPLNEVDETVTAGKSSLQYDAAKDQYTYVWKTERSWRGSCRALIVRLNDGTDHVALFSLR